MTTIVATGLAGLTSYLHSIPDLAKRSARTAINRTARGKALRLAKQSMAAQIAFPPGYLEDPRRLDVTRLATVQNLEAAVSGRIRPTSLARFAPGQTPEGTRNVGVRVRVKSGAGRSMTRAFLIHLRSGSASLSDASNLGLAIRLRPGERVLNKKVMRSFGGGLYLLYGPSVNQVFKTVAVDISPDVLAELADQFLAEFDRATRGV